MKLTLHRLALATLMALMGASCTTAYDAYGRPRTVVEPGAALVGAAAVGLLAYGLASTDHYHGGYYGHRHGYRGYDRCY
jgi:hypothetical protein